MCKAQYNLHEYYANKLHPVSIDNVVKTHVCGIIWVVLRKSFLHSWFCMDCIHFDLGNWSRNSNGTYFFVLVTKKTIWKKVIKVKDCKEFNNSMKSLLVIGVWINLKYSQKETRMLAGPNLIKRFWNHCAIMPIFQLLSVNCLWKCSAFPTNIKLNKRGTLIGYILVYSVFLAVKDNHASCTPVRLLLFVIHFNNLTSLSGQTKLSPC